MLHRETIEPDTLSLILSLQEKSYTQNFLLVGGTALALQLGHRTSADIDLFTNVRFDVPELLTLLQNDFTVHIRNQMNHALLARGRRRDFIDLYCLLNHFTLTEILDAFLKKYKDATLELAIRSLFYFEDADNDLEAKCFFDYNWNNVKAKIKKEASKL